MNFLTTPILYGLGAVALALGIAATVQTVRLSHEQAAHQRTKTHHAEVLADLAEKTRKAADLARDAERAHSLAMSAIDQQHQKALDDARNSHDRALADLRSGALQLRDHWTCPTTAVPTPGTSTGSGDEDAERRNQDAAALVQIADQSDADLAACQAVAHADRLTVNGAP